MVSAAARFVARDSNATYRPSLLIAGLKLALVPGLPLLSVETICTMPAVDGTGLIVNVAELDVPPPGAGLTTVTFAAPAVAMSEAGIWAVI